MQFWRTSLAACCGMFLAWSPAWGAFSVGDCVVFREGGEGRLLKSPTFWVSGVVSEVRKERGPLRICPGDAPGSLVTREVLWQLARAAPCVFERPQGALPDVEVTRVRMAADAWETPWSSAHGETGLLFRGTFMGEPLAKGGQLEMPADWLRPCAGQP